MKPKWTKPKPGQVWRYGGAAGRPDKIKSISRGGCGKWKWNGKRLVHDGGKSTAMWVKWESGMATISVRELFKNWVRSL